MAVVRLPFGDITWNRNCCAPDLIRQAIDFPLRKTVGHLVDFCDHIHGLLPNDEIFEMLSHIVRIAGRRIFWVLVTEYWILLPTMPYMHDIPILHDVVFPLQTEGPFRSRIRFRTGL